MPTRSRRAPDYGAVRRYGVAHVAGALIVLTVAIGLVTWNWVRGRDVDIATSRAWSIEGPPCPQLTAADWAARRQKAPKVFDYDGTQFGRWAGDASCSDVKTHGGTGFGVDKICQFTNPVALTVVSPAGAFYFLPGVGQPATLAIHKDVPRCVLSSKFTRGGAGW